VVAKEGRGEPRGRVDKVVTTKWRIDTGISKPEWWGSKRKRGKQNGMNGIPGNRKVKHTNLVCKPVLLDIIRIPNMFWEVRRPLIDVHKFDKFGIEVRVSKRSIGHQRIVEMLRVHRISF